MRTTVRAFCNGKAIFAEIETQQIPAVLADMDETGANSGDKQVGVDDLMTQFTAEDMIETSKIMAAKRQRPALAEKDKT
jgi:hypothetical protein